MMMMMLWEIQPVLTCSVCMPKVHQNTSALVTGSSLSSTELLLINFLPTDLFSFLPGVYVLRTLSLNAIGTFQLTELWNFRS